jgi:hypothetical protein
MFEIVAEFIILMRNPIRTGLSKLGYI